MRDRQPLALTLLGLILLLALVLSVCGGTSYPTSTAASEPPTTTPGLTLSTEWSPAGRILATGKGMTLYDFTPDTPSHSACVSNTCVFIWPPLLAKGPVTAGRGAKASLIHTIRRPDGQEQITYGGHPLYTYTSDTSPGLIVGQGVFQSGGTWYVVAPSGHQITTSFTINSVPNSP